MPLSPQQGNALRLRETRNGSAQFSFCLIADNLENAGRLMLSGIFCFPDEIYLETMNPGWGVEMLNRERKKSKGHPLFGRKTPSIKCWTADEVNLETMNPGWGSRDIELGRQ